MEMAQTSSPVSPFQVKLSSRFGQALCQDEAFRLVGFYTTKLCSATPLADRSARFNDRGLRSLLLPTTYPCRDPIYNPRRFVYSSQSVCAI